jgi:hypothetical protein
VLITLGAAFVALACMIAAGRRLAWAVAPTGLEPRSLSEALLGERGALVYRNLRRELALDDRLAWEHALFAAFDEPEGPRRDALVNEQLLEFEGCSDRWVRVPRVCASIGSSAGLLFGSLALLQGLAIPDGEGGSEAMHAALSSALDGFSLGIVATSFCVAVHVRAARVARARRVAVDALVERLRSVSDTARRSA